ncbi:MAG: MCE family protein [Sandaracinaceae bacterium]|jgi:phospholipid/cholesterol/gamma-HCH transport system substrate-binding protein|nr:MCE family protein [Sandaracinaceae bacterium]
MKGLSIEARVGLLVLVSGALLAVFVFVLSGVTLKKTYTLYVDFDNPGAVQTGAPVRIGGIKVGSVEEVRYLGGRIDPHTGRRALVRLRLSVQDDVRETVHDNALFYVTAQGVLGEQFIAVDPGTAERPVLRDGAIMHGVDPPRLDLALALGYELLETLTSGLRAHREEFGQLLDNVVALLRDLSSILHDNRGRIDNIIANIEAATAEANTTLASARTQYIDGPQAHRIMSNLDRALAVAARDLEPILTDVRSATHSANETLAAIGPEQRQHIQSAIENVDEMTGRANHTLEQAQQIVAHVRAGEGTVGAMLMDEEIYDDVQELIRDLKHNPWKLFWRE